MSHRTRMIVSTILTAAFILSACQAPATASPTPRPSPLPPTLTPPATVTPRPSATPAPTATRTPPPSVTPVAGLPAFSHVFIIVLENKNQASIVGSAEAPYINQLAAMFGRASRYYGIRHPSLPNYLALTGGDTFNIASDCIDCFVDSDNLAVQLEKAGRTWKAYMEDLPADPCYVGDAAPLYKQKHNPFIYYDNIRTNPARCAQIVPLTELPADLQTNSVPDFVWITPNMCHDMHDCPITDGDNWLKDWVAQIMASPAWQDRGVLFITFDEGEANESCCALATGGLIDTLVVSPLVKPGFVSNVAYNHYSLLRTIEEAWNLPLLNNARCGCSVPMLDFFASR